MHVMDKTTRFVTPDHDGQVLGSVLIGLVKPLKHIQAISGTKTAYLSEGIESTAWYPMGYFFKVLNELSKYEIDFAPILFYAGSEFIEDWYLHSGGKEVVNCAVDFLRLQGKNGGYSLVHRGDPDKVGWQELIELDESEGRATVVCINPYPMEFERGVMHGGMLLAGDVQFVHVESHEEPYNDHLNKKTITIRFRVKPDNDTDRLLDTLLAGMSPEKAVALPAHLTEAMAWRLKGIEERYCHDRLFFEQSSLLLSKATNAIYELSQKLDRLAHEDELTGLLTRRAVFEKAKNYLALGARHDWEVSFIVIDIDHFKSINDTWGHATGDDTLRWVATLLGDRLRGSDLLGRIGGEEFLIVLPETDLKNACILAESLRDAVEHHLQWSADHQRIPVTISLGVTTAEDPREEKMDLYVKQADEALYQSKRNGRNLVTAFSP